MFFQEGRLLFEQCRMVSLPFQRLTIVTDMVYLLILGPDQMIVCDG